MGRRIDRFEDLVAWQKARVLNREIRAITRTAAMARELSLSDQLRRAARSIMANIAEGFDRVSRNEFHQFLVISKGSCAEVRSDLYALLDDLLISQKQFDQLYTLSEEVARIIGGLRASVARQRGT